MFNINTPLNLSLNENLKNIEGSLIKCRSVGKRQVDLLISHSMSKDKVNFVVIAVQ